jgi:hypothetical protein
VLDLTGKPVYKLMEKLDSKLLKKVTILIDSAIESGLRKSIYVGKKLTSDDEIRKEYIKLHQTSLNNIEDIRSLSLRKMDTVADTFLTSNGVLVATEGAEWVSYRLFQLERSLLPRLLLMYQLL